MNQRNIEAETHGSMTRGQDALLNQELKNTVKYLKQQLKTYKDEVKSIKHDSFVKQQTIERQEKTIDKLRIDHVSQQAVTELSNELKKTETKLRKMKERSINLKESKEALLI